MISHWIVDGSSRGDDHCAARLGPAEIEWDIEFRTSKVTGLLLIIGKYYSRRLLRLPWSTDSPCKANRRLSYHLAAVAVAATAALLSQILSTSSRSTPAHRRTHINYVPHNLRTLSKHTLFNIACGNDLYPHFIEWVRDHVICYTCHMCDVIEIGFRSTRIMNYAFTSKFFSRKYVKQRCTKCTLLYIITIYSHIHLSP